MHGVLPTMNDLLKALMGGGEADPFDSPPSDYQEPPYQQQFRAEDPFKFPPGFEDMIGKPNSPRMEEPYEGYVPRMSTMENAVREGPAPGDWHGRADRLNEEILEAIKKSREEHERYKKFIETWKDFKKNNLMPRRPGPGDSSNPLKMVL